jgi:hypothetical protein
MERAGMQMAQWIAGYLQTPREKVFDFVRGYYTGDHPAQLKIKTGQADDNVTLNWIGLAIDRAVSMLIGDGVKFDVPEGAEAQQEYIDAVWDGNKREILMHEIALDGAAFGTPFIKIVSDGITDPFTGVTIPRLVLLDPKFMDVETDPLDKSEVERYTMQFKIKDKGKERVFKEVTRHARPDDFELGEGEETPDTWVVETFEFLNNWVLINTVDFPYDFPPIHHWKNLPSIHSIYGMSDIEQVINPQDKYNFVASNNVKITRYHAHPKTWGAGFTKSDKTSWGADEMITVSDPAGKIANLEMSSDLSSSRNIQMDLRQAIFDIARQVDVSGMKEKIGQLTNFGLRLLFSDALSKTDTKRLLYGDAFSEINRRLLVMAGYEGEASRPGEVVWGDALPVNDMEEMQIDKLALELGIVDKQTVSEKYQKRYGVEWDEIQARLTQGQAQERNLGSLLLQRFNQGQ